MSDSPEANNSIACSIIRPIPLRLTQLTDTDGGQADIATTGKAKEDRIDDDHRNGTTSREPQGEGRDETQGNGQDHRIEPTEHIGDMTR